MATEYQIGKCSLRCCSRSRYFVALVALTSGVRTKLDLLPDCLWICSPTLRRRQAKQGQMSWHTGNVPTDNETNIKKKFKTSLCKSHRESFGANSVDLSTIRDSTLQSLLAPPLPPSAVHSPPPDSDICYEADSENSEDDEPILDDRLTALATTRWENNINFGDSPM